LSTTIKCPDCNATFNVDEADYANILEQVRTQEFHKEIEHRLKEVEANTVTKVQLAVSETQKEAEAKLAKREQQIATLQAEIDNKATEIALAKKEEAESLNETIQERERRIAQLEADLKSKEDLAKAAADTAAAQFRTKEVELQSELATAINDKDNAVSAEKTAREIERKRYEEEILSLKDFKHRLGSALIGADLEEHCLNSFNKVRSYAFPNAKFEKDTKAVKNSPDDEKGTKGDFIFKDYTDDGLGFLSIMFEMKNEKEGQEDGEKNEKFFKKLDEDRKKKGCEFAVLVTQLEPNNPVYNDGIVDVSYAYDKMYVIRPQLFIPLITLLRTAAVKNIDTIRQLNELKQQNLDFSKFEEKLGTMQGKIAAKAAKATEFFGKTLKDIDDAIAQLEKAKADLLKVGDYLGDASDAANKITIKELTSGNETMKKKFKELESKSEDSED
jgi:hypothetical protein